MAGVLGRFFGFAFLSLFPLLLFAGSADTSLTAGLDPRVGLNLRLGDDPSQLPANMLAQAEPHIARHPTQPDIRAATFQEGRYTDGGAVHCGYSITQDGGPTRARAVSPGLTPSASGPASPAPG